MARILSEKTKCNKCGQNIRWAKTSAGRSMPLDATPNEKGTCEAIDAETVRVLKTGDEPDPGNARYIPHWASCPYANQFRR